MSALNPPRLLIAASALAVCCAAGCSSSGSSGSSTPAPPPSTLGPTVPASGAPATDAFSRNEAWFSGVQHDFTAIQTDTEQIKAAAGRRDVAALPRLCAQLKNDAVAVDGAPAPPDPRIAAAVAHAMDSYKTAADSCLKGDYGATADGINAGGSYLQQANSLLTSLAND